MKPLELIVWARNENYPGASNVVYEHPDGLVAVGDLFVDAEAHEKRLTDAELAAEVFSAVFHEAECEVRGMRIERGFPPRPGHPAVEHYVKLNREFGRQAMILERFATLPHYDEATL